MAAVSLGSRGELLGKPGKAPALGSADPDPTLPRDWWAQFEEMLQGGDRPLHFDRPFGAPLVHPRRVDEFVRSMQGRAHAKHVRVYCEGKRRDDLARNVMEARAPEEVPLFDWMRSQCKSDRMAFIVNDVQDWSEPFARAAARFLAGHYESRNAPPAGAELVLFAGNYEATPFGAHRGYEHAFLAHLGPANKEFYIWSFDRYRELTGGTADVPDYAPLLPYATSYTLKPGDLLYLPAQWYHIGTLTEYSVSVAIPLYQPDPARYLADLVSEYARGTRPRMLPRIPFTEAGITTIGARLRDEARQMFDGHGGHGIDEILLERWRLHRSNGGLVRRNAGIAKPAAIDIDHAIARVRGFPILLVPVSERARIYARHRSFEVASHPALERLVGALNSDQVIRVRDIIGWFSGEWEESAAMAIIQQLSQMQAIEPVATAS